MIKDLLLQFFLSIIPVFVFLLWHDKERGWKGFVPFITIACGAAMILCVLTSSQFYDYDLDFRLVPYLIGSLYGGLPALAGLTVLYAGTRIPMLDNSWEAWCFIAFISLAILLLFVLTKPFKTGDAARKERIAAIISLIMMVFFGVSQVGYFSYYQINWTPNLVMSGLLALMGVVLATWLSVFIIEGTKEKQQLYLENRRLSGSYRNEVEKLQQFIDKAPMAVAMVDENGIINHVNEETLKLLKLTVGYGEKDKLLGEHFDKVFDHASGEAGGKLLKEALNGSGASLIPNMEEEKIILYISIALRDASFDKISGAALIAQDVTELWHLRFEVGRMERLSLVGQMAASITHEIRNPMAVIRGFVQLLQERSPQSQYEYFRIIMEELDRANLIISDFLSLAQNRELKMEYASINSTINDLVPLINADANLRGQTLEVELSDSLPDMPLNNREMKQMLLNLARNGMEAMGEKGMLHISTNYADDKVSVRISDNGVGIPRDKMGHLFEPFYTTKTRGTGLGLPLCLSIAERHGGRIEVESTEGEGTTFIVTFDIAPQPAEHTNR